MAAPIVFVVGDESRTTVAVAEALRMQGEAEGVQVVPALARSFLEAPGLPQACVNPAAFIVALSLESPDSTANGWRLWRRAVLERHPGLPLAVVVGSHAESASVADPLAAAETQGRATGTPLFALHGLRAPHTPPATATAAGRVIAHLRGAIAEAEALGLATAATAPLPSAKAPPTESAVAEADDCCWDDPTAPAVFHGDWRTFAAACIRHGKEAVTLLCDTAPHDPIPSGYKASAPSPQVEHSVTQLLAALDGGAAAQGVDSPDGVAAPSKGGGVLRTLTIRLDAPESVCISMIVGVLKHVRAHPGSTVRALWGEGGTADPECFDALAVKLCGSLPNVTTFGLRRTEVTAGATGWAALAETSPKLGHILLEAVPCSPQSPAAVAGLAAFLRDSPATAVTARDCGISPAMLKAIVGSLPTPKQTVATLNLEGNSLTELPGELPVGLPGLTVVRLGANGLTDAAIPVLARLTSLRELDLADNALTAFPLTVVEAAAGLWRLDLSRNKLAEVEAEALGHPATRNLRVCHLAGNPLLASLPSAVHANPLALQSYCRELAAGGETRWVRGRVVVAGTETSIATELQLALAGLSPKDHPPGEVGVVVADVVHKGKVGDKLELIQAAFCRSAAEMGPGHAESPAGATAAHPDTTAKVEIFAADHVGAGVLLGQPGSGLRGVVVLGFSLAELAATAADGGSKKLAASVKSQLTPATATLLRDLGASVALVAREAAQGCPVGRVGPKVVVALVQPDKCPEAVAAEAVRHVKATLARLCTPELPSGGEPSPSHSHAHAHARSAATHCCADAEVFVVNPRKAKTVKPFRSAVLAGVKAAVGGGLAVPTTLLARHARLASLPQLLDGGGVGETAAVASGAVPWGVYAEHTAPFYRDLAETLGSTGAGSRLLQPRLDAAVLIELGLATGSPSPTTSPVGVGGAPTVCVVPVVTGGGRGQPDEAALRQLGSALAQRGVSVRRILTNDDGTPRGCTPFDAGCLRSALCTLVLADAPTLSSGGGGEETARAVNRLRDALVYAAAAAERGDTLGHTTFVLGAPPGGDPSVWPAAAAEGTNAATPEALDPVLQLQHLERPPCASVAEWVDRAAAAVERCYGNLDQGRLASGTGPSPGEYLGLDPVQTLRTVEQFVRLASKREGVLRHGSGDTPTAIDSALLLLRAHGLSFKAAGAREDLVPRARRPDEQPRSGRPADPHGLEPTSTPASAATGPGASIRGGSAPEAAAAAAAAATGATASEETHPWVALPARSAKPAASRLSADWPLPAGADLADGHWGSLLRSLSVLFGLDSAGATAAHFSTTAATVSLARRPSSPGGGLASLSLAVASWDAGLTAEVFRLAAREVERGVPSCAGNGEAEGGWRVAPTARWPGMGHRGSTPARLSRTSVGPGWDSLGLRDATAPLFTPRHALSHRATPSPRTSGTGRGSDGNSSSAGSSSSSAGVVAERAAMLGPLELENTSWTTPQPPDHGGGPPIEQVVLIHSAEDSRFAQAVAEALRATGVCVPQLTTLAAEDAAVHSAGAAAVLLSPAMLRSPPCLRQLQLAHRHGLPVTSVGVAAIPGDREYDSIIGQAGSLSHAEFAADKVGEGCQKLAALLRRVAERQRLYPNGGFGRASHGQARDVAVVHLAQDTQVAGTIAGELERRGVTGWLVPASPRWGTAADVEAKLEGADHVVLLNLHWSDAASDAKDADGVPGSGWAHRAAAAKAAGKAVATVLPASAGWLDRCGLASDLALLPQPTMDVPTLAVAILGFVEGRMVLFGGDEGGDGSDAHPHDPSGGVYIDVSPSSDRQRSQSHSHVPETDDPRHRSSGALRPTQDNLKRAERKARFKQHLYSEGGPHLGDPTRTLQPHTVIGAIAAGSLPEVLIPMLHKDDPAATQPQQTPKAKSRLAARKALREAATKSTAKLPPADNVENFVRPRFSPEKVVPPGSRSHSEARDAGSPNDSAAGALGLVLGPGKRAQASRHGGSPRRSQRSNAGSSVGSDAQSKRGSDASVKSGRSVSVPTSPTKSRLEVAQTSAGSSVGGGEMEAIPLVFDDVFLSEGDPTPSPDNPAAVSVPATGRTAAAVATTATTSTKAGAEDHSAAVEAARESAIRAMADFHRASPTKLEATGEPYNAQGNDGGAATKRLSASLSASTDTDPPARVRDEGARGSESEDGRGPEGVVERRQPRVRTQSAANRVSAYLEAAAATGHSKPASTSSSRPHSTSSTLQEEGATDAAAAPADGDRAASAEDGVARPRLNSAARAAAYLAAAEATAAPAAPKADAAPPRRRGTASQHITKLAQNSAATVVLQSAADEKAHLASCLSRAEANDPTLTALDISNVRTLKTMADTERDGYFEKLAEALRSNTHITELKLNNVGATDFAAEEIADALAENGSVEVLSLETNDVRGPGVGALAATLKTHPSLRKLSLSNQAKALPTRAQHKLVDAVEANERVVGCSAQFHDATAADRVGKALLRNADRARQARARAKSASISPIPEPDSSGGSSAAAADAVGGAEDTPSATELSSTQRPVNPVDSTATTATALKGGLRGAHEDEESEMEASAAMEDTVDSAGHELGSSLPDTTDAEPTTVSVTAEPDEVKTADEAKTDEVVEETEASTRPVVDDADTVRSASVIDDRDTLRSGRSHLEEASPRPPIALAVSGEEAAGPSSCAADVEAVEVAVTDADPASIARVMDELGCAELTPTPDGLNSDAEHPAPCPADDGGAAIAAEPQDGTSEDEGGAGETSPERAVGHSPSVQRDDEGVPAENDAGSTAATGGGSERSEAEVAVNSPTVTDVRAEETPSDANPSATVEEERDGVPTNAADPEVVGSTAESAQTEASAATTDDATLQDSSRNTVAASTDAVATTASTDAGSASSAAPRSGLTVEERLAQRRADRAKRLQEQTAGNAPSAASKDGPRARREKLADAVAAAAAEEAELERYKEERRKRRERLREGK